MQVILTRDNHSHVIENQQDLLPLVEEYMGRDAYYYFRDYIDKVDEVVDCIQEHILKLDAVNDNLDSTVLDNIIEELDAWLEGFADE